MWVAAEAGVRAASRSSENCGFLRVCDVGTGFVAHPSLCRVALWQRTNVGILHDHAGAGVPSQNGVVVSGRSKIHGLLVMTHRFSQHVICGSAGARAELANTGVPESFPNDAGVIGLLVVAFNLSENFLSRFRLYIQVELICAREEKINQRLLVVGHNG